MEHACNSNSRGSDTLLDSVKSLVLNCIHTHMHTTSQDLKQKNLELRTSMRGKFRQIMWTSLIQFLCCLESLWIPVDSWYSGYCSLPLPLVCLLYLCTNYYMGQLAFFLKYMFSILFVQICWLV